MDYGPGMPEALWTHVDVLFTRDAAGRLTATRDATPRPAPRVFVARSKAACVVTVRADVPAELAAEIQRLIAAEPPDPDPSQPSTLACAPALRALFESPDEARAGPLYRLPSDLPPQPGARILDPGEAAQRLTGRFRWLAAAPEYLAPLAIAEVDGVVAAACHSPRGRTATAAEAGVLTLEAYRGRGLATAVVVAWAGALQRLGLEALYSTTWSNRASRAIAARLSAQAYGSSWQLE